MPQYEFSSADPESTFELGRLLGTRLRGGEVILLSGPLGAGKTLFTKGVMSALEFDVAEVTSPSFALVNRYEASLTVYHIDLWRIENPEGAAFSVGIDELLDEEDTVLIIEWAERLGQYDFGREPIKVEISGDGSDPREVIIAAAMELENAGD